MDALQTVDKKSKPSDLNDEKIDTRKITDIKSNEWEWPCYDEFTDEKHKSIRRYHKVIEQPNPNWEETPFEAIYDKPFKIASSVRIFSPHLLDILYEQLGIDSSLINEVQVFPTKSLYLKLKELSLVHRNIKDMMETSLENIGKESESNEFYRELHIRHLIRFIHKEFDNISSLYRRMNDEKRVSFEMLWTFYRTGERIFTRDNISGQQVGGLITYAAYKKSFTGEEYFVVSYSFIDYDGHKLKRCTSGRKIDSFQGWQKLSSLDIILHDFAESIDEIDKHLDMVGNEFEKLATGQHYMQYNGPMMRGREVNGCWTIERFKADGRVMIDLKNFSLMNPGYKMGQCKPPHRCDIEQYVKSGLYCDTLTLEERRRTSATVWGFSFALKEWGQFDVLNFNDIIFDDGAFDSMVMDSTRKTMLEAIVSHYVRPPQSENNCDDRNADIIKGKGAGFIFLCYGPPGTGKTLTAESVAEKMKRPLWSISVAELGINPGMLETALVKILDVARSWNAVLLLDEADIYLERRSSVDITRNAMVAVFLRLLEYYQGILFLTTNRVTTFDDAFCSRIRLFIRYNQLQEKDRYQIWCKMLPKTIHPDDIAEYAKIDLNGREIRNVVNSALLIAASGVRGNKGPLDKEHINESIKIALECKPQE